MGLLDNITGGALGSLLGGGKQANLISALGGLLGNQQTGGLNGLVQQFASKGLGDIVNSWVGTGPNKSITPEQIQQGLGSDIVNQLASKVGIPANQITSQLANLLPGVIDKLTPNGQIPQGDVASEAMNLLKGFLK
jgi:uncharacterized protein YidB (DUF937 family)